MPLSRVFQRLVKGGLIVPLPPTPPQQPTPPGFRTDLHCAYHQKAGHDTDSYAAFRNVIQDLIDQGLVDLGRPGVTIDLLPPHDTRVVRPEKFQFMEKGQKRNFDYKIVITVKNS